MKKIMTLFIIAGVLGLLLSACGSLARQPATATRPAPTNIVIARTSRPQPEPVHALPGARASGPVDPSSRAIR